MNEKNRFMNEQKKKGYGNFNHSALNYVQPAIENAAESSRDATQTLINNIMNKQKK
jgi:hypothetical protein